MANQPTDKDVMKAALAQLDTLFSDKKSLPKLTNKEMDKFEAYLDSHAREGYLHLELLDGFLCALITGPVPVSPEEYIPVIFGGGQPSFTSQEQADEIMGYLKQHWDHIESTFENGDEYYPFLYADPDGKCSANDWAYGFAMGIEMRRDAWMPLVEESQEDGLLTQILKLYSEGVPELSGGHVIPAQEREEMVEQIVRNLGEIYDKYKEERAKNKASVPMN